MHDLESAKIPHISETTLDRDPPRPSGLEGNGSRSGKPVRRWTPVPNAKWHFDVDIVGSCNLRCPSCPAGNSLDVRTPTAYMRPELLEKIVRKAASECKRLEFALYNWTEPFLHPKLPEMVRIVRSHGVTCLLSTNLHLIRSLDAVMEANPDKLRISLSGFTQENYGVTHKRGDIDVVKKNMQELARAKDRIRSTTRIEVSFHRYLGNHEDEAAMRQFAEALGFEIKPAWAYLMPLEKALAFADGEATDVRLTEEDHRIIERLALPLDEVFELMRNYPKKPCELRDRQMALTCDGNVMLCCTVYDQRKYTLGPFLEITLDELQEMKYRQALCGVCMKNGLHTLFTYDAKELDELALRNVARHYPDANLDGVRELARERRLRSWPRKVKREYGKILDRLGIGG